MHAAVGEPARSGDETGSRPAAEDDRWPWFGPVMLAMGIAFVVFTLAGWHNTTALVERGLPATATVVSKYTSPTEGGYEFRVRYSFATADGSGHTGDHTISEAQFDALQLGDAIAVIYLAEDPGISVLAPYGMPSPIILIGALAFEALFIALGAGFTIRRLSGWTERRL